MGLKSYIPDFLLPIPESERQHITPYYDPVLRRELFQKAKPGNEYTLSASRHNSAVKEKTGTGLGGEKQRLLER